ncbi:MAG TPA: NUDIX domain-containing protein [Candidatus Bathyarchaeia archaeon]|nr:NUDIX domain-containing protein [Candidatus Bathyarchaeia archaeon]
MTNNPEPEYPTGPFTIGVGGVVIENSRALLVKLTYGHKGWILPGGYVKSTETIGRAVCREVYEETGLKVQASQIVSVRSRVNQGKCDIYVALLVKVVGGELRPDHEEVSDIKYFTLSEMESCEDVPKLNTWIVRRALQESAPRFSLSNYNQTPEQLYELWF